MTSSAAVSRFCPHHGYTAACGSLSISQSTRGAGAAYTLLTPPWPLTVSLLSWPFLKVLLHDKPDIFFVTDYATGRFDVLHVLARALSVPLIARHAGSVPERYLGRFAKRWTIPHTDCLIVSSRDELEMLASRYRVPRERLRVILTPVDTNTFRPMDRADACRAVRLDPARRYLLFMGRFEDPVKQVSGLIRSFATLADKHGDTDLVIVGAGPDGSMLRRLAGERAPGRVRFPGWIAAGEEKARLYNAAECLVLNSRKEGFPRVVAEAMACGTPVLAPRVGGVGELVTEGQTGWLFAPGDEAALTTAISFVLHHSEAVASMRPLARDKAERCVSPAGVTAALRTCFSIQGRAHE